MGTITKSIKSVSVRLREIFPALQKTVVFEHATAEELSAITTVDRLALAANETLTSPGDRADAYWVILSGEVRVEKQHGEGERTLVGSAFAGMGFGEIMHLTGRCEMPMYAIASSGSVLVRFTLDQFWQIMASSPSARTVILTDAAQRLQIFQAEALHREKLVSLGTLAAGLMHELHNPGSAAKRAAGQLRENLMKLQQLSLRSSQKAKTPEQMQCMRDMLEHSMSYCRLTAMSSLEQADAEEAMGDWLSKSGVENAYTIGPVLVAMGFDRRQLECARDAFEPAALSDALNWLGALVSSVSQVCEIEESISRISDLAMAVKKFAYDDRSTVKQFDIHDSLQSTITILAHKLRLKQVKVQKDFKATPSVIETRGSALSQVWTNLIDNAADASSPESVLEIATWTEPDTDSIAISITDHGEGIPKDVLPRIFEPFFTTKPQGSGTGLGLDIVKRIVTDKFRGKIDVSSKPGLTTFTVRLPLHLAASPAPSSNPSH